MLSLERLDDKVLHLIYDHLWVLEFEVKKKKHFPMHDFLSMSEMTVLAFFEREICALV